MYKIKLVSLSIVSILSINSLFAVGGAGLHIVTDQVSVSGSQSSGGLISLDRGGFDNPLGIGGYLYLDAIPFVDLDLEFQVAGKDYKIMFTGLDSDFAWGRTSYYFTVKKKIFSAGIPFLAKAKVHVGACFNSHSYTPLVDIDMIGDILTEIGGNAGAFNESKLIKGLKDILNTQK